MFAFSVFLGVCASLVLGVRFGAQAFEWMFRLFAAYGAGPQPFPSRPTPRAR